MRSKKDTDFQFPFRKGGFEWTFHRRMNRCPACRDTSSSSSRSQRWNTAPMQHDAMTTTTIVLSATCVLVAHDIEPRPAEHPSRTCVGKYAPRHDSAWQVTSLRVPRRNTRRTLMPGVECDCTRHGPRLRRAQPSVSFGNDGPLSGCTVAAGAQPQLDRALLSRGLFEPHGPAVLDPGRPCTCHA